MDETTVSRVIALLDEAKEEVSRLAAMLPEMELIERASHADSKITTAQNLLVGGDEPSPRMN
jgi:hypothetical protein